MEMQTQNRRRAKSVTLPNSRWTSYAAAGAATALAGVGTAEADIHYSGPINALFASQSGVAQTFALQNNAAIRFVNVATQSSSAGVALFRLDGAAVSNQFRGIAAGNFRYPDRLENGQLVSGGAFANFNANFFATLAYGGGYDNSQFLAPGVGFIGFRFNVGNGMQFGWARVDMAGAPDNSFTLVDYAWGDAGDAIRAGQTVIPEPGSLGLLAVGAVGLVFWRKRRAAAAPNS
jgi:hypothetical protein